MSETESESEVDERADAGAEKSAIVVVDPDPVSRNAAEDLEDDLDRQVVAMDSMEFDPEVSEEIAEAGAFVIVWDLGIRSGADLVEKIRSDDRLAGRPIIVATAKASTAMVQAALAVGADSVCRLPYDGEEVEARLAHAEEGRAPSAA